MEVRLKSVANERHFTRKHETVFGLYLTSHSSMLTETSCVEVPTCEVEPVKIGSKSAHNLGHCTREQETVFRLYLAPH
jgi:hypothetical protein